LTSAVRAISDLQQSFYMYKLTKQVPIALMTIPRFQEIPVKLEVDF
jgi:hypothetical protein